MLAANFGKSLNKRYRLILVLTRQMSTCPNTYVSMKSQPSGLMRTFSTSFKSLLPSFSGKGEHQGDLVIIGSGWAGYKLIKGIDKQNYNIKLVSPTNYFTFTPLLPSTSVGTLEFRSAIEPVRSSKDIEYYQASCKDIDFENKFVTCTNAITGEDFTVPFGKLVIACGATSNTFNIPGVKEHANFLKDITHARSIRQKIIENFEIASQPTISEDERQRLLHFVVVGGGPTGVEFTSELFDFLQEDFAKIYPHLRDQVRITLYDVAPKILPTFDDKLSKYATEQFIKRGINVQTGQGVTEVKAEALTLKNGSTVPYGLLVWSTGLAPNALISKLDSPKDRMKRLYTDAQFRVLDKEGKPRTDIYAIGDCATIMGNDLPCTAQVAKQKAQFLAQNLNMLASTNLEPSDPFVYKHRGSMAYIGDWKAVVDMGNGAPKSGLLGWLIWRAAYMTMAESLRNKIKIPTYWALTMLLGREVSKF